MGIYPGLIYHIVKGLSRDFHWHPEVEVLFAVEGCTAVTVKESTFQLQKGDVLVVNSSMSHRVVSDADAILCYIRYPWKLLDDMVVEGSRIFACNSAADRQRSYRKLQERFQALVYEYVNPIRRTWCNEDILMLEILRLIIEDFQIEVAPAVEGRVRDDVRIQQIVQYVNRNFQQNISLSSLAEELYLSPSTLSRFFKKNTGIYFVDYVNQVRARFGLVELIYSDASITEIAVNSGFSNLSVFSRIFKEIYGMTPTDYRRRHRQDTTLEEQEQEHLRSELAQRLPRQDRSGDGEQGGEILASSSEGRVYSKVWNLGINVGFLDMLTQNNLRSQVLTLCQNLGFQYVRLWNIFSRRLMLTDGVQIGGYNYGKMDEALDFLVEHHLRPFLDLSRRPLAAVRSSGDSVFVEQDHIDFRSRRAWESMFRDFVRHVVKRYGQDEVNQWIFECYVDRLYIATCPLYHDEEQPWDPLEVYRFVYETVKALAPGAQVGGPAIVADFDAAFSRAFLTSAVARGCKPDFVSCYLYPYEVEEETGGKAVSRRMGRRDTEVEQLRWVRRIMHETGTADCRLYVSEWSNTLSNRNFINDCCARSAYIAHTANLIWDGVDMACLRMASDIVGGYYDTYRAANGDMGLMTIGGVRKPSFFALQFLNSLGEYVVKRGEGYIITRTSHGRFFILCYNYKWFSGNYFLRREWEFPPEELQNLWEDDRPLELHLVLEHLSDHTSYFINRQVISCSEGSLLHEWGNFQYEESQECRQYLKQVCFPRMSMVKQTVRNGRIAITERLEPQEVSLLYIYSDF